MLRIICLLALAGALDAFASHSMTATRCRWGANELTTQKSPAKLDEAIERYVRPSVAAFFFPVYAAAYLPLEYFFHAPKTRGAIWERAKAVLGRDYKFLLFYLAQLGALAAVNPISFPDELLTHSGPDEDGVDVVVDALPESRSFWESGLITAMENRLAKKTGGTKVTVAAKSFDEMMAALRRLERSGKKVRRLVVVGHGDSAALTFGDERNGEFLTQWVLKAYDAEPFQQKPVFLKGAAVSFISCALGRGEAGHQFAELFGKKLMPDGGSVTVSQLRINNSNIAGKGLGTLKYFAPGVALVAGSAHELSVTSSIQETIDAHLEPIYTVAVKAQR